MQKNDQKTHNRTLMLAGHPKRLIIDGIDLNFTDSGEEPCKGTTNFAQLGPPLDD
jgi:hypothetical protein